jgi:TetR/AcrR family transcriptional repressor of nem operon
MKKHDINHKILTAAEELIQTQGYNAFSYKDICAIVGIKTSSIHYYFPTKADLGKAVVKKQLEALSHSLEQLIQNTFFSCQQKLEKFIDDIIAANYSDKLKMCLGGMLASDVLTLPEMVQHEVKQFFASLEKWLKELLLQAIRSKEFVLKKISIHREALFILSLIEGALLLARLFQDEGHLVVARQHIIDRYCKD